MQKIASYLPSWDTTKKGSKKGFDKAFKVVDKLGAPINRLSNRIGSEAFWPTTLDKESDKAARILKSFCSTSNAPKTKSGVFKSDSLSSRLDRNCRGPALTPAQQRMASTPSKSRPPAPTTALSKNSAS